MKISLNTFLGSFLFAVLISAYMVFAPANPTNTQTTISNTTITKQVAIAISNNMSSGVLFDSLDPNTNNNNATGNVNSSAQTQYWTTVDSTTNTPIDICVRVNDTLRSGSNTIPNAGYTWNQSTTNNNATPSITAQTAFTTSFDTTNKVASSVTSGQYYYRFLLDVPSGQTAGTYSNKVEVKGADSQSGC